METASLRRVRQLRNQRRIIHRIADGQPASFAMSCTRPGGVWPICWRKSSSPRMRAVVQRVSRARVTVEGTITGEIGDGLMILLGVGRDDTSVVAVNMAEKIANLRIFEDDQRKMNHSLLDVNGSALVVSQFTLYADARGQRRPSFVAAAAPEQARKLYEEFSERLRGLGITVASGVFGAMMSVELINEGSVTILVD